MRYCTVADLELVMSAQVLRQLSNDDPQATELNEPVVEEAINQAEEMVDGFLRGRYQLPLATVPTLVKQYTAYLARHWLYARRPEGNDLPDAVTRTYKDAVKGLETIRDGKLHLGIPNSGIQTPEPRKFQGRSRRREFNDDLLGRY